MTNNEGKISQWIKERKGPEILIKSKHTLTPGQGVAWRQRAHKQDWDTETNTLAASIMSFTVLLTGKTSKPQWVMSKRCVLWWCSILKRRGGSLHIETEQRETGCQPTAWLTAGKCWACSVLLSHTHAGHLKSWCFCQGWILQLGGLNLSYPGVCFCDHTETYLTLWPPTADSFHSFLLPEGLTVCHSQTCMQY